MWSRLRGQGIGATLARGASGVFVVTSLGQALMFGLMVFLARLLGVTEYGAFVYALSWLNILMLVSKLGLDTASLRFVASYVATEDYGHLRGLLRRANAIALLASVVVAGLAAWAVMALSERLSPSTRNTLLWAFAVLPFMTLATLRYAALRGLKRVVLALLPERVLRPILTAGFVAVAVWLLGVEATGAHAMMAYLAAVSIGFCAGAWWLYRSVPSGVRQRPAEYRTGEWLRTALTLLIANGAFVVTTQTDTIMVGALIDSEEAGVYYSANRVTAFMQMAIVAIQQIAAPMLASFHARGEHAKLQRTLTLAVLGAVAFAVPAGVVLALIAEPVLSIFGPEFVAGEGAFRILIAAQAVNALTGMTGLVMSMTGHQAVSAIVISIAAAVNVVLNAVLIPRYGIEGAAIATLITTAGWNVPLVYYAWRRLGLWTLPLPWRMSS